MRTGRTKSERVKAYGEMATMIRELCMRQTPIDFRHVSRTMRIDNKAGYALIPLGIIENTSFYGGTGKGNGVYTWRNPNNLSDLEIGILVISYYKSLRIAKGKRIKPSRNPRQTILTALSNAAPPQVVKDKPKQVTQPANGSNVNVVRLKLFGLTIFEYEKRGKN